jgi:ParB family chromosome partitioning protein
MSKPATDILPIDFLEPNPLQPRGSINADSIADLVDSIKQHGILEPLVVAKTPAGYQIVAGERRWRAAKVAGLESVPVIIKETTPQGMLEMAIIENIQRTDLNPIERAKGFERLMREFHLQVTEIGTRIGKSTSYVSNSLRLLFLPDALKDGLLTGVISEGHARALAAIEDTRTMIEAYKTVLKEGASVRRAEELARRLKQKNKQKPSHLSDVSKTLIYSDALDRMQIDIEKTLGKLSQVKLKQSLRETKIIITLKGAPTTTNTVLERVYTAIKSAKK